MTTLQLESLIIETTIWASIGLFGGAVIVGIMYLAKRRKQKADKDKEDLLNYLLEM